MYLVPFHKPTSMCPDPTSWLVTALVDELETLADECREAASEHLREAITERSSISVRSLNQAAATCDDIAQLIRAEYLPAPRNTDGPRASGAG